MLRSHESNGGNWLMAEQPKCPNCGTELVMGIATLNKEDWYCPNCSSEKPLPKPYSPDELGTMLSLNPSLPIIKNPKEIEIEDFGIGSGYFTYTCVGCEVFNKVTFGYLSELHEFKNGELSLEHSCGECEKKRTFHIKVGITWESEK